MSTANLSKNQSSQQPDSPRPDSRQLEIQQGQQLNTQAQRLHRQLTVRILFVVAGSLILVLTWALWSRLSHWYEAQHIAFENSVIALASTSKEWLHGKELVTEQISSRSKLRDDLQQWNQRKISHHTLQRRSIPKLKDALTTAQHAVAIMHIDQQLSSVVQAGYFIPKSLWFDLAQRTHQTRSFQLSQPVLLRQQLHIIGATPMINRNSHLVGVCIVAFGLTDLRQTVSQAIADTGMQQDDLGAYLQHNADNKIICIICDKQQEQKQQEQKATAGDRIFSTAPVGEGYSITVEKAAKSMRDGIANPLIESAIIALLALAAAATLVVYFLHPLANRLVVAADQLSDLVEARTKELSVAMEEAKKANLAKSQFLANMSHEIRTPLNGVVGNIDLLLEENQSPRSQQLAQEVSTCSDALLAIVNDILDFSKIESGYLEFKNVPVDISATITENCRLFPTTSCSKIDRFIN